MEKINDKAKGLKASLQEERHKFSQEITAKLVESMPRCLAAVIQAKGLLHTKYEFYITINI